MHNDEKIAVIGLGYVGFPLSISLAEKYEKVIGFDISAKRVSTLTSGVDYTNEVEAERIKASTLQVTDKADDLAQATFYIVTVPTPIDQRNRPDLQPMMSSCDLIGPFLKKGDVVVFESTVYPGVTEDICGPRLEEISGLKVGRDFNLGYSPERISPGDKDRPLENIVKNVSADTPEALDRVARVYERIIDAGIHRCASIKVAEGAKVLENTQRDINIALMNELALICARIGVKTRDVIEAASTKWNFVPYYPGLVGGHCIGVDPYYLSSLSEEVGHHPEVILAGRRLNDSIATFVANATLKNLARTGASIRKARVGLFGLAFKENVPDMRNSKSLDLAAELQSYGVNVMLHDPHVDPDDAEKSGITLASLEDMTDLEVMILAVGHQHYLKDPDFLNRLSPHGILMDVKSAFSPAQLTNGQQYWSL